MPRILLTCPGCRAAVPLPNGHTYPCGVFRATPVRLQLRHLARCRDRRCRLEAAAVAADATRVLRPVV